MPRWLRDAVFYEVYPQSFYDSNGDGIGDLPGITAKLDYIQSLGVNAIWLNPCFESPFQDAGYDVSDFYRVAPRYGSNEDLCELFTQAHSRGLRVILDLVAGHTSIEHPWFKASCADESNRHSNYYIWTDGWLADAPGYRFINGYAERNGNYMTNFFYCQPALNYGFHQPDSQHPWQLPADHPDVCAVREELRNIMKFWLDMGADGFRVDMAASLVRGDADGNGIRALWHDYRSWMDTNYPDAVLVAEWSCPEKAVCAGFHIDFMVHFNLPGYTALFRKEPFRVPNSSFMGGHSFFDRSGKGDAKGFMDELISQLQAVAGKGYVSVPTGNHDLGRIRQGRTPEELKVIYAFILTLPGVPFIYYGDEIGMNYVQGLLSKEGGYNRTGARTPMQWDSSPKAGFSTAVEKLLYLPVDSSDDRPDVVSQQKDPDSLLNFCRRLIQLRRSNPALASDGELVPLFVKENRCPLVYERRADGQRFIIAVNPFDETVSAEFACPEAGCVTAKLSSGCEWHADSGTVSLTMAPVSYGIYSAD
jgi:maltose alpha-D-glucosyltransferase/alpha-amylase